MVHLILKRSSAEELKPRPTRHALVVPRSPTYPKQRTSSQRNGYMVYPRGSRYLIMKELRLNSHIYCGLWDVSLQKLGLWTLCFLLPLRRSRLKVVWLHFDPLAGGVLRKLPPDALRNQGLLFPAAAYGSPFVLA